MANKSTMQPFAKGDIFAGATLLNNAEDDHAGDGRIIQYDSNLNEKGVLWTKGTSHLIGGLRFSPDGVLWAFDSHAFKVLRVNSQGEQLPDIDFPKRAFSNVCFAKDGSVFLGEHVFGNEIKLPPGREMKTTIPFMPGSDRFGDGHVFQCGPDGSVLKEFNTEVHGGLPGFLGVTCTLLAPDGKTLTYVSELGNRVMRYDLEADTQLPDLVTFDQESGDRVATISYLPDHTILMIRANFRKGFDLNVLDGDGQIVRTLELPGPGWANLTTCADGEHVVIGNFFNGAVAKMNLESGALIAQAETNVERSLAGLAEFAG